MTKTLSYLLGSLLFLIAVSFYFETYDSCQIKITLFQISSLILLALWGCKIILQSHNPLNRANIGLIWPFLAYLVWICLSYFNNAYKPIALDQFIRHVFYMLIAVMIIIEFRRESIDRLTKFILAGAAIVIGYGLVQVIDVAFFYHLPQAQSLDPFAWKRFIYQRIAGTFGNPQFFANYLLIVFFIAAGWFLKKRSWWLLVLMAADLVCLYYTKTRAAWLAFGITSMLFAWLYAIYFMRRRRWVVYIVSVLPVLVCLAGINKFTNRQVSVDLRAIRWLATWDMIKEKPIIGHGVGSFKTVYPKFQNPEAIRLKGNHVTITEHASNEFLQQWAENGIVGLALFLWIIIFVCRKAISEIKDIVNSHRAFISDNQLSFELLGYLMAFIAMLIHSFFDISMRQVSSGIYFAVLPAVIIVLGRRR